MSPRSLRVIKYNIRKPRLLANIDALHCFHNNLAIHSISNSIKQVGDIILYQCVVLMYGSRGVSQRLCQLSSALHFNLTDIRDAPCTHIPVIIMYCEQNRYCVVGRIARFRAVTFIITFSAHVKARYRSCTPQPCVQL